MLKINSKDLLEDLKKNKVPVRIGYDVYDHFIPRTAQELGLKVSKTLLGKVL